MGRRPAPSCGSGGPRPRPSQDGAQDTLPVSGDRDRALDSQETMEASGDLEPTQTAAPGGQGRCPLAPGWAASEAKVGSQGRQGRGAWSSASADRRHSQGAPTAPRERSRGQTGGRSTSPHGTAAATPEGRCRTPGWGSQETVTEIPPRPPKCGEGGAHQGRPRARVSSQATQARLWAPLHPRRPGGDGGTRSPQEAPSRGGRRHPPQGHQRHEPSVAPWPGPAGDAPVTG